MMLHRLLREISKDDKELGHVNSSHLEPSANNMHSGLDSMSVDKSKQEEVKMVQVDVIAKCRETAKNQRCLP